MTMAWLGFPVLLLLRGSSAFTVPGRSASTNSRTQRSRICMEAPLLDVEGLCASVGETPILNGVNLKVKKGEVHAIMGPNGSGKSTLSKVLAGHPAYEVTGGTAKMSDEDLMELEEVERAHKGLFLAFQYPVEIPGVSNSDFLRVALNKKREAQGLEEIDPIAFFGLLSEKMQVVNMDPGFLSRDCNCGFSGGEKKRNEILQMVLLEPEVAILDETDSGLDVDALKTVAAGVNAFRSESNGIVLITHYQRLLDLIKPDFVHCMYKGQLVRSGGPEFAMELEEKGYAFLNEEATA